jgi:hypothetical protein
MKMPAGAIPDSTVITFVYEKQGQQVEFTADNFPEDFDDSVYHFVKRYDKLIRKGNAEAPIKDFVLNSLSGADTTGALLSAKGYSILLFIRDKAEEGSWRTSFEEMADDAAQKHIPSLIITNNIEDNRAYFKNDPVVTWLRCDVVPIKTAARANPTLYLLQNGTIIDKWGYADFDEAKENIQGLSNQ